MRNTWRKNKIEVYSCPRCLHGAISFANLKTRIAKETAESREMREHGVPPWTEELCVAIANCSACSEPVSITFSKITNEDPDPYECQHLSPSELEAYEYEYNIKSIHPSPHIINIPIDCPKQIKIELIKSFNLYWVDEPSCVNKIRVVLELLMDELKVAKGKLHRRIESLSSKHPELSEVLEAVKWIGNIGSHETAVDNEEVLKAYEILEYGLEEIYAPKQSRILKISREVNHKFRKKP